MKFMDIVVNLDCTKDRSVKLLIHEQFRLSLRRGTDRPFGVYCPNTCEGLGEGVWVTSD